MTPKPMSSEPTLDVIPICIQSESIEALRIDAEIPLFESRFKGGIQKAG